jgi:hypothetical protein
MSARMGARLAALALAPVLAATAAAPAIAADGLLWQAARPGADCRLRVVHEQGALQVRPHRRTLRLVGAQADWQVEASTDEAGGTTLRISPREPTAAVADGAPLRLEAPARCRLALETGDGAIEVMAPLPGLSASTRTGAIVQWLPRRPPPLELVFETSGESVVDFSVEIDYRHGHEPAKRGIIRLGEGGAGISLHSRQGTIRVLRDRDGPGSR